jgi:hypothetical protein
VPGLTVSLNYYNIRYTNRIDSPALNAGVFAALLSRTLYAPLLVLNPSYFSTSTVSQTDFNARAAAITGSTRPAFTGVVPAIGNVAAHGYLVIAIGPIGEVPPLAPRPPEAGTPAEGLAARVAASANKPPPSTAKQLSDAIDWAAAQNRSGPLAGRIDMAHVAAIGHSCGGLQAVAASAADARVTTTVLLNSGVFVQPAVAIDKDALDRLRGPIAYFIGGAGDMASPNAEDDFARISRVPVLKANSSFGHGGRSREAGGGPTAAWVVRSLDWQLKGERAARSAFAGANCGMCRAPGGTVARKGLD